MQGQIERGKLSERQEGFLVWPNLYKFTDCAQPVSQRIVIHDELCVPAFSGLYCEIAHNGRYVPRSIRKSEGGQGVERLEYVSLAGNECSTKGRIEEIFLQEAPSDELFAIA